MPLYSQSRRFQGVAQCLLPSRYRLRACECEVLTYRQIAGKYMCSPCIHTDDAELMRLQPISTAFG